MKIFLLFILLFSFSKFIGQQYNFKNIGKEKKLTTKYTYDITQGDNHLLYLATENGLVSYNGEHFNYFEPNDDIINTILKVDSILYLGYFKGQIKKYNTLTETFTTLKVNQLNKILQFSRGPDNAIYCLIQGQGVFQIKENKLSLVKFGGVNSADIITFSCFQNHFAVAGTKNTYIYKIEDNGGLKQINNVHTSNLLNKTILHIVKDQKEERIAFVSEDYSVQIFSLDQKSSLQLKSEIKIINLNSRINELIFGEKNTLWIATKDKGLYKILGNTKYFEGYNTWSYTKKNGLNSNQTKSVFIDNQSVLWTGYYNEGVSSLSSERIVLFSDIANRQLTDLTCIAIDNFGSIYLGSETGVKKIQLGSKQQYDSILFEVTPPYITTLAQYKNKLWIGTAENGLFYWNGITKKLTSVEKESDIFIEYINDITVNKATGNLLIASDLGMFTYNESNKTIQHISTNEGLVHNVLNDVLLTNTGVLWFASDGVSLFSYENEEFIVHKDFDKLHSYTINNLTESSNGSILAASESDGLIIIKDNKLIKKITTADGLDNRTVLDVKEGLHHSKWCFHRNSISILDSLNNVVEILTSRDLFDINMKKNSIYNDVGLYFWIATNKGLLRIEKDRTKHTTAPSIQIKELKINSKVVSSLPSQFNYGSYNFKFSFEAIDLNYYDDITYEYFLDGYEYTWNIVNVSHDIATYPRLQEGSYSFRVRAKNKFGVFSNEIIIPFVIKAPFWKELWFLITAPLSVILLVIGIFQWRYFRIKKQKILLEKTVHIRTLELRKEKENLSEANILIEHKNKEITDSINYAERIQKAILPDLKDPKIIKENIFVLFQPCDIVSGDFYWVNYKDDQQIVIVADCTGHGVPGAFMSLISSTLIDKIILDNGITSPVEIVKRLDEGLENALRSGNAKAKDGIDIGVISINRKTNKVFYCGASRPLYCVKNKKLDQYNGGLLSVGEHYENIEKKYICHRFEIEDGMTLYLSSDGFPDQFGGPKDKKYMVGKFKKKLVTLADLSFEQQEDFLRNDFTNWKGSTHQTDDILVIGIKL